MSTPDLSININSHNPQSTVLTEKQSYARNYPPFTEFENSLPYSRHPSTGL